MTLTFLLIILNGPSVVLGQTPGGCNEPNGIIVTEISHNQAKVQWQGNANYYYLRYRQIGQLNWLLASTSANTRTLSSLNDTTEYEIQMQSYCGNSNFSPWVSDTFTTLSNPNNGNCPIPNQLSISNISTSGALINWSGVNPASGYVMYALQYRIQGQNFWYNFNTQDTFKVLTSIPDSTLYEVRVRSNCGNLVYSSWSTSAYFTTQFAPIPLCNPLGSPIVSEITAGSAKFSWNDSAAVDSYFRYRELGASNWTNIYVTSPPIYIHGLKDSTMYEYSVRAHCGAGNYSDWTPTATLMTLAIPSPPPCLPPTSIQVDSIGSSFAKLSWDSSSTYTYIRYKPLGQSYWNTKATAAEQITLYGLGSATSYEFQIRSYCSPKSFSAWTPLDTFLTPGSQNSIFDDMRNTIYRAYNKAGSESSINNALGELSYSPNPTSGMLYIRSQSQPFRELEMVTLQGKLVGTAAYREDGVYDLSFLPSGIYIIRAIGDGLHIKPFQLIKY